MTPGLGLAAVLAAAPFVSAALAGSSWPSAQSPAAGELWSAGQRLAAIERAAQELAQAPGDDALRSQLVAWEIAVHRYRAALGHMDGGDPRRGLALYALARYEEALEHLDLEDPAHAAPRVDSFHALGRFEEAEAAAERAAELLGDDHPDVLFWRGRAAARRSDPTAAAELFARAVAANPLHQAARFALGRALLRTGEREAGRAVLERHRALVPLIDAYEFTRQGLDLDPTHAPNRARVAEIEAELGLLDAAEHSFARAAADAEGDERVPVALRHARFHEEQRGDRARAVRVLEQALRAGPDPRLHVRAADVLERAGDLDAALEHLEAARVLRPEDRPILERIARVQTARRDA